MPNARVIEGAVTPDIDIIREVIKGLRKRLQNDKAFAKRCKTKPRQVLGELGLNRIIQNQMLEEDGRKVRYSAAEQKIMQSCHSCSGCCCTGCCFTTL